MIKKVYNQNKRRKRQLEHKYSNHPFPSTTNAGIFNGSTSIQYVCKGYLIIQTDTLCYFYHSQGMSSAFLFIELVAYKGEGIPEVKKQANRLYLIGHDLEK